MRIPLRSEKREREREKKEKEEKRRREESDTELVLVLLKRERPSYRLLSPGREEEPSVVLSGPVFGINWRPVPVFRS